MLPGAFVAVQLLLAGCIGQVDFPCEEDAHCDLGLGPACIDGYCAAEDSACESGYRFGEHGPRAGQCTAVGPGPTSTSGEGSSTSGEGSSSGGPEPDACAADVRAHAGHACALHPDGRVSCWGDTAGTVARSVAPSVIAGATADRLSVGDHACYRSIADGSANCWGENRTGAIDPSGPVAIFPPEALLSTDLTNTNVVAVGAGDLSTCVAEASDVFCLGTLAPDEGFDVPLPGGTTPAAVGVGREHVCVVDQVGGVWCAGANDFEQLGSPGAPAGFVQVSLPPGATKIAANRDSTCALTSDGLWCWGRNTARHVAPQVGPIAPPTRASPETEVEFVDFAIGTSTTCATGTDGFFYCWGTDLCPEVTLAGYQKLELFGTAATGAASIAVGDDFMCFVASDGLVRCWGMNDGGQLGSGTTDPACVASLREVQLDCE